MGNSSETPSRPWTGGFLPVRRIEPICNGLSAVCTHRNQPGVRRPVCYVITAGATRDEILETS